MFSYHNKIYKKNNFLSSKFNYKNKPYVNVMNGQTGKVGGAVPRSAVQITLFTIFLILVIGLPLLWIILSMF